MTTTSDSRQLISSFLAARQKPDGDAAGLLHSDFTFESPLMRFEGATKYLQSHRSFQNLVKGTTMISELYGPNEATLLYDLETATPAGVQRTAEHFRITDGKVASIILLFDSAPWRPIFEHLGRG
ncbi:MAG TPA: nuclear transport factor 2 family protein [Gemmataceae bacterium]|nr:nuclear transport factor 2 family protein [Gemmataceae bacterium]